MPCKAKALLCVLLYAAAAVASALQSTVRAATAVPCYLRLYTLSKDQQDQRKGKSAQLLCNTLFCRSQPRCMLRSVPPYPQKRRPKGTASGLTLTPFPHLGLAGFGLGGGGG
jgi:hypothetical protein